MPVEINAEIQNAYGNDYYDDEFDDDEHSMSEEDIDVDEIKQSIPALMVSYGEGVLDS